MVEVAAIFLLGFGLGTLAACYLLLRSEARSALRQWLEREVERQNEGLI
jgi:predicted LPLAT superfamily acyltransferase